MDYISFGKHIEEMRVKIGLSRKDVSNATGISLETIRRVEIGIPEVKLSTLEILSNYYKVNLVKEVSQFCDMYFLSIDQMIDMSNALTELDFNRINDCFNRISKKQNAQNNVKTPLDLINRTDSIKSALYKLSATDAKDTETIIIELERILLECSMYSKKMLSDLSISDFEYYISSILAIYYRRGGKVTESISLCLLVIEKLLSKNDNSYFGNRFLSVFYFNLLNAYHILDQHSEIIKVVDCIFKNENLMLTRTQISGVLYRKSIAQYYLNDEKYYDTITSALSLSMSNFRQQMISSLNKHGISHHLLNSMSIY